MLGVYVHFPYCRKRCPYCDFAVSVRTPIPHHTYKEAVFAELRQRAPLFASRPLVSIYFGGGTPSLWQTDCLVAVVQEIKRLFGENHEQLIEITVECDPLDLLSLPAEDAHIWQQAGINRLSIGVQSLQDNHLFALGRLHNSAQAKEAVLRVKSLGFENISLDVMIGLPEQKQGDLLKDLHEYVELQPDHISVYQLTVEPQTALAHAVQQNKVIMPDEEFQAMVYQTTQIELAQAGFVQYEISSYARMQPMVRQSTHNQLYWNMEDYLGVGVSAHSFRGLPDGSGERFANSKSVAAYLQPQGGFKTKSLPVFPDPKQAALYEHRPKDALQKEALWLGLRQTAGIDRAAFLARHGVDPVSLQADALALLQRRGLVEVNDHVVRLTSQGVLFADEAGACLL